MHDATVAARTFAATTGARDEVSSRLAIVVEELVTNLYDHGGLTPENEFEIELSAGKDGIRLILVDTGRPFDPAMVEQEAAIPARGGGAGLRLVRAWASRIEYQSVDGRNRLVVVLPIQGGA